MFFMTYDLMAAYAAATELEKSAFLAVMVKNATVNETYQGMKIYDAEKKAEAEKEAAYKKGYQMRDEAAKKFNKLFPNT